MAEDFDSIVYEIDFDAGSWTDVSASILSSPRPRWRRGIMSNRPTDRVAMTGIFTFALRNTDGTYSPGHASVQSGFGIGNKVRLSFVFEGETWYKFYGRIKPQGIKVIPGTYGKRYTLITVHDWIGQMNVHELRLLALATNQRSDQALTTIDGNLEISPLTTDYATGVEFTRIFHNVKDRTKAIAEINKIVNSELGLYYVTGDRTGGETVVMDARYTRSSVSSALTLQKTIAESGRRLAEDGDYLLDESGDKRVWSETQAADFDNIMTDMAVSEGKHLANVIKTKAQQVEIDATATTVLFNMEKVLQIDGGVTITNLRSAYTDPTGADRKVSGDAMVTPAATTDYTANAEEGGGGADLTANLSVTGPDGTGNIEYGVEAAEYGLKNTGGTTLYVTKLQFRGKGIYDYQTVDYVAEDDASKETHGAIPITINFVYEDDVSVAQAYGEIVLSETKDGGTTIDRVTFNANRNSMTMYGFLQGEPGSRYPFDEDQTGIDDDYFWNGYEAEIIDGKIVNYSIVPKIAGTQAYWRLGYSSLDVDTALGIG